MKILNISYALPSKKVSNQEILETTLQTSRNDLSDGDLKTIESKIKTFYRMSGSKTRYVRQENEKAMDFAIKAGQSALKKSGLGPLEIDLLIYAGVGRGWMEPATANLFQGELKLKNATCFDVLDACASWVRAMSIAKSFIDQGTYKNVMVLTCEFNHKEYVPKNVSSVDEIDNYFSGFTIGEAATATVLTADEKKSDVHFSFKTWGDKHRLCLIPLPHIDDFSAPNAPNGFRTMKFFTRPGELLSFTIKKLVEHFRSTPALGAKQYDLVIGHAVSVTSTKTVARLLGIDTSKVFETHDRFGNTVSASLSLALSVAEEEGRLKRGMNVLLVMGSAGVTTAYYSFTY